MPRSRDEQAYDVVRLVRQLNRTLASVADGYLEEAGLSAAEHAVMEFLFPAENLTVPEIAARYDVSRQHVQVTVNKLLEKGLVRPGPNPQHKRSPRIGLSDNGRATFEEIRTSEARLTALLFSNIRDNDLDVTHRTLASVHARLGLER